MNNQEILQRAIQKAIDGGWKGIHSTSFIEGADVFYISGKEILGMRYEDWHGIFADGEYEDYGEIRIEAIIFNPEFAQKLWGEDKETYWSGSSIGTNPDIVPRIEISKIPAWKHHLQMMVIAEDRIAYLGDNI